MKNRDDSILLSIVKDNILKRKRQLNLTYEEINERAGLCCHCTQRIINYGISPKFTTLNRIARALDCNIEDLMK